MVSEDNYIDCTGIEDEMCGLCNTCINFIGKDKVNKPNHYIGEDGLEVEEILQQFIVRYKDAYVAHRVASAIEYLLRAPLKNGNEDIRKAGKNIEQILDYIE